MNRKKATTARARAELAQVREWADKHEGRQALADEMTRIAGGETFHRQEVGLWIAGEGASLPSFGAGLILLDAFRNLSRRKSHLAGKALAGKRIDRAVARAEAESAKPKKPTAAQLAAAAKAAQALK